MKTFITRILFIATPFLLISIFTFVSLALAQVELSSDQEISFDINFNWLTYSNNTVLNNLAYLPVITRPWQYEPITPPPYSISYYIKTTSVMYALGCEQGQKDLTIPGLQDSIVVLFFGLPWRQNGVPGVILHDGDTFKSTVQIQDALVEFASGYWTCVGPEQSHIVLAAGTNSQPPYTNYTQGHDWAEMVFNANQSLNYSAYSTKVSIVGAANMELGFNSQIMSRAYVDGYNDFMYDPIFASGFPIFNIGDAQGCYPFMGDCGSQSYPDWTQEDIWYISYGCEMCKALPMIYHVEVPVGLIHAQQWQQISKYSVIHHGSPIYFSGAFTQYMACQQRPIDCYLLDNTPEDGYKQLYTVLYSDVDTRLSQYFYKWSSDIKWEGE